MSNLEDMYPSSTQPESQEDFEKVDPGDFDQQPAESERDDQVPTSTAYTGDEAEEDRYGTSDNAENLVNFGDDLVLEEPQSTTTPSAPEVGDISSGLGQFAETDREGQSASLNPFSDPYTTTTSANDYAYGDEDLLGDFAKPVSAPKSNLLSDSTTESYEFDEKPESLPISGGSWMKNVDPRVLDLVYWRDVRKTAVVFGGMMFMLLSLSFFSVLSVVAYLALAALTITLSFRVYKNVLQAVQKTGDQHPFKHYLDMNIDLPEDKVQRAVENITKHVNNTSRELRRLFLVEDLIDSIKFGLFLWVLTYIGAWFNGMTILILDVVGIFTIPKFYETYKTQIDSYVNVARTNINKVLSQIKHKIPFPKKKEVKKE